MTELYLGYASFTYYAVEVYKYKFDKSGQYYLSLNCEGKQFFIEILLDVPHAECGYIYINAEDLRLIFNENADFVEDLQEKCWRRKGALLPGETNWHCHLPDELKRNINIKLDSGERVYCKYNQ